MDTNFIISLLSSFLLIEDEIKWLLSNNFVIIRLQRFGKKVNYQEIDENGRLIKGYWLLEDKTLYGPYTDHMET